MCFWSWSGLACRLFARTSSATSDGYVDRVLAVFLDNLGRYLAGDPLRNVVDAAAV